MLISWIDKGRRLEEPRRAAQLPAVDDSINDSKDSLPIVNPEATKTVVVNNNGLPLHDDGIDDDPKRDFYKKTTFAWATLLLPVILATIAVATVSLSVWNYDLKNTSTDPPINRSFGWLRQELCLLSYVIQGISKIVLPVL